MDHLDHLDRLDRLDRTDRMDLADPTDTVPHDVGAGVSGGVPAQRASSDAVAHTVPAGLPAQRRDSARSALAAVVDLAQDWARDAACVRVDPDELFVQGAAQHRAKTVCLGCPVRTECLSDALDNRVEFGVWGGMTERERRALLKRRPDVTSWKRLLEAARREHLARVGRQAG